MANEIKIIGNVKHPTRYNPDLIQEAIEEDRLEKEMLKKEKAAGKKEDSGKGAATPRITPKASSIDDYILLKDINCVDAGGKVFESYPELYVKKDIFRQGKEQLSLTPYDAVLHCEKNGLFLPSFALTCNILAGLYKDKQDSEIKEALMQYKNKGNGNGWHAQNTLINFAAGEIIHYPSQSDFGGAIAVNLANQRIARDFSKLDLCDKALEEALRISDFARYVQSLTGLEDPSILVDIGKYFKKPAKAWFPWNGQNGENYKEKRACWLGCNVGNFILSSYCYLDYGVALRGVRKNFP